jgi:hypothetical protein
MAEAAWRTNVLNTLERSEKMLQQIAQLLKKPMQAPIFPFFGQTRLNTHAPLSVTAEPSFSYEDGTPAKGLIDSNRHVQADILTMANPSNLDVALSTRLRESPNEGITIQQYATAGVGLFNAVVYFTAETS